MAGKEDINFEGSSIEKLPSLHESTNVVNGRVVAPESNFERTRFNKGITIDKPQKCSKNNCRLEAVMRVTMHKEGPKSFCPVHWDKIKDTDTYDVRSKMFVDPEMGKELRGQAAVENKQARVRASDALLQATGEYSPVRGPGRIPRDTEDHVTPVIESAAKNGGRSVARRGGTVAPVIRTEGHTERVNRELLELREEVNTNPTPEPSDYAYYSDLMDPDIPSAAQTKPTSEERPD